MNKKRKQTPACFDPAQWAARRKSISQVLIRWYHSIARDLPWRHTPDPYRVWVSEIMLQQTQAERVKDYFQRFVTRFPSVFDLADADESVVLRHWEGLGYYSRARNLKKAAQSVIKNFNGVIPDNFDDLKSLSGIGDYTANAILAIAFNKPYIPLDGNVERIIKRYLYLKKEKEIQKENLIEKKSV